MAVTETGIGATILGLMKTAIAAPIDSTLPATTATRQPGMALTNAATETTARAQIIIRISTATTTTTITGTTTATSD